MCGGYLKKRHCPLETAICDVIASGVENWGGLKIRSMYFK